MQLCSKRCEILAKKKYNSYIDNIESKIKLNFNIFWSFIKSKRNGKSTYPALLSHGDDVASNGCDICNMFGSYFSSVYNPTSQSQSSSSLSSGLLSNHFDSFSNIIIRPTSCS